ncbi:MAG: 4-deoxy-4-formamido-L-arabinose-phosphoundecaprenol deformylase [Desulfococcaceae bacterium]
MNAGLRIDADTFRGTRYGVPNLCRILAEHSIRASFFFSVGPDNMGRHLLRLFRPSFLRKMLRSKAPGLYGWDILFKGTLGPGPLIGEKLAHTIRSVSEAGHEIGLHAWDHHAWQTRLDRMNPDDIRTELQKGFDMLLRITGYPPTCSAAPAWKGNDSVLTEKKRFPFLYNSDCRGHSVFLPLVKGRKLSRPQIPVTLPTYDEVIGQKGITDTNYNEYLLSLIRPDRLNVLTIHAEVEGMSRAELFADFVKTAQSSGLSLVPLGRLLPENANLLPLAEIVPKEIPGREGWCACQG